KTTSRVLKPDWMAAGKQPSPPTRCHRPSGAGLHDHASDMMDNAHERGLPVLVAFEPDGFCPRIGRGHSSAPVAMAAARADSRRSLAARSCATMIRKERARVSAT